jgi:hypothetical protein
LRGDRGDALQTQPTDHQSFLVAADERLCPFDEATAGYFDLLTAVDHVEIVTRPAISPPTSHAPVPPMPMGTAHRAQIFRSRAASFFADSPAVGDVEAVVSGCGEGGLQLACRDDRHAEPEGHSDAIGRSAIHGDHATTMP